MPFQSTRPSRGATYRHGHHAHRASISIHAPLAGRDGPRSSMALHTGNFNPRAPRGARHYLARGRRILFEFQSTRPSRGATE